MKKQKILRKAAVAALASGMILSSGSSCSFVRYSENLPVVACDPIIPYLEYGFASEHGFQHCYDDAELVPDYDYEATQPVYGFPE